VPSEGSHVLVGGTRARVKDGSPIAWRAGIRRLFDCHKTAVHDVLAVVNHCLKKVVSLGGLAKFIRRDEFTPQSYRL
jgi:hypothetical protein